MSLNTLRRDLDNEQGVCHWVAEKSIENQWNEKLKVIINSVEDERLGKKGEVSIGHFINPQYRYLQRSQREHYGDFPQITPFLGEKENGATLGKVTGLNSYHPR